MWKCKSAHKFRKTTKRKSTKRHYQKAYQTALIMNMNGMKIIIIFLFVSIMATTTTTFASEDASNNNLRHVGGHSTATSTEDEERDLMNDCGKKPCFSNSDCNNSNCPKCSNFLVCCENKWCE